MTLMVLSAAKDPSPRRIGVLRYAQDDKMLIMLMVCDRDQALTIVPLRQSRTQMIDPEKIMVMRPRVVIT